MPEWISSGILDQVSQFGLEIHTPVGIIGKDQIVPELSKLLDVFRQLYDVGFRLISSTNNDCVAKSQDFEGKYLNYFELVFYKQKSNEQVIT